MTLVFLSREVAQRWSPPFSKTIQEREFRVQENEKFDTVANSSEPVFTVIQGTVDRALVAYRRDFTLKGHEHPGSRQIWLNREETREFSFQWGDHGITKKLTFKGFEPDGKAASQEEAANVEVYATAESAAPGKQQTMAGDSVTETTETL